MNSGAFIVVISVMLLIQSEACIQKFKRATDLSNYTKSCFTKAGFSEVPTREEIQKPDFNSKCAAKCIMGAIDVIDEQGKIDKDALSDFLGENVSEQTLLKLNEMATTCVDSSGADTIQGTKQGTTSDECKSIDKFYTCFIAASDKLC